MECQAIGHQANFYIIPYIELYMRPHLLILQYQLNMYNMFQCVQLFKHM